MNANEVIASLASERLGRAVHPNDEFNASQPSTALFPPAIPVAPARSARHYLLPALGHLADVLDEQAEANADVVKAGRTHLMDATPVTLGQEMAGYPAQVRQASARLADAILRVGELPLGGTATGTGLNAPAGFARAAIARVSDRFDVELFEAADHFAAQGARDSLGSMSGELPALAAALLKIPTHLRWKLGSPSGRE